MPPPLLLVIATLTLAGFVQGLTGFGFGITAMAVLPLLIPVTDAQVYVTLMSLVACAASLASVYQHASWSSLRWVLPGLLVGVPVGFGLLVQAPAELVRRSLGVAIVAMVLYDLCLVRRDHNGPEAPPTARDFWVGLASGALSGAFNMGGPPVVAFAYAKPWPLERVVALLNVVFLASGSLRLSLVVAAGQLSSEIAWQSAAAAAPMLAASFAGSWLLPRAPQAALRRCVYAVLLGLGMWYACV